MKRLARTRSTGTASGFFTVTEPAGCVAYHCMREGNRFAIRMSETLRGGERSGPGAAPLNNAFRSSMALRVSASPGDLLRMSSYFWMACTERGRADSMPTRARVERARASRSRADAFSSPSSMARSLAAAVALPGSTSSTFCQYAFAMRREPADS